MHFPIQRVMSRGNAPLSGVLVVDALLNEKLHSYILSLHVFIRLLIQRVIKRGLKINQNTLICAA